MSPHIAVGRGSPRQPLPSPRTVPGGPEPHLTMSRHPVRWTSSPPSLATSTTRAVTSPARGVANQAAFNGSLFLSFGKRYRRSAQPHQIASPSRRRRATKTRRNSGATGPKGDGTAAASSLDSELDQTISQIRQRTASKAQVKPSAPSHSVWLRTTSFRSISCTNWRWSSLPRMLDSLFFASVRNCG